MSRVVNKGISIRFKVTIYATLIALVVLAMASALSFKLFSTQLKQTISEKQYQHLSSMAEQIDARLKMSLRQIELIAGDLNHKDLTSPEKLQMFLDKERDARSTFTSGFVIISDTGILLAASPASLAVRGEDYSFRDYVKNTLKSGKPFISSPFKTLTPPYEPQIAFSMPIKDRSGKTVALLAGVHNLLHDSFLQSLADYGNTPSGYMYIFSLERVLVVHPETSRVMEQIKKG